MELKTHKMDLALAGGSVVGEARVVPADAGLPEAMVVQAVKFEVAVPPEWVGDAPTSMSLGYVGLDAAVYDIGREFAPSEIDSTIDGPRFVAESVVIPAGAVLCAIIEPSTAEASAGSLIVEITGLT